MAEGFARVLGWNAFSAGVNPSTQVNHNAVKVMDELSIDISRQKTNSVDDYVKNNFDVVVTVCDHAKEQCPLFTGSCETRVHHSFHDPYDATGSPSEILSVYREVRDQIYNWLKMFTQMELSDYAKK